MKRGFEEEKHSKNYLLHSPNSVADLHDERNYDDLHDEDLIGRIHSYMSLLDVAQDDDINDLNGRIHSYISPLDVAGDDDIKQLDEIKSMIESNGGKKRDDYTWRKKRKDVIRAKTQIDKIARIKPIKLDEILEPIEYLNRDPNSESVKAPADVLGRALSDKVSLEASKYWSNDLPEHVQEIYMDIMLKASLSDMIRLRTERKLKAIGLLGSPSVPDSDESLPSLDLSSDSESSGDSQEEILEKLDKTNTKELQEVPLKNLETFLSKYKEDEAKMDKHFMKCAGHCFVFRTFLLILTKLGWISRNTDLSLNFLSLLSVIIFSWLRISPDGRFISNPKDAIKGFTKDVQILMKHKKDGLKENMEKVFLYRDMVAKKLNNVKDKTGQKAVILRKQLSHLFDQGREKAQDFLERAEYEMELLSERCLDLSDTVKDRLELEVDYLMKFGRAGARYYKRKMLDELEYLTDLSTKIYKSFQNTKNGIQKGLTDSSQKALTYPGIIKNESLLTMKYIWRLFRINMNGNAISVRNHFRLLAHALGNAAAQGAVSHFQKTAKTYLKTLSNAEAIVYNTAYESAERVGAGMYFGLRRKLLSDILRMIFFVIPTFVVGSYIYDYVDEMWSDN